MEEEGSAVFFRGYQKRGPNNERKRIYYSALTPDLYGPMYSDKIKRFLDALFDEPNEGKPLMQQYYQRYFDLYWNLHLGIMEDDIPPEVRQIGQSFMVVLGFWYPMFLIIQLRATFYLNLEPYKQDITTLTYYGKRSLCLV
jgi:hypothetical protein